MGSSFSGSIPSDFFYSASNNELSGKSVIRKFGRNTAIGTTDVVAPYNPLRLQAIMDGVTGFADFGDNHLLGVFSAKTDIGFMAKVPSGTSVASVEFKIILKAN